MILRVDINFTGFYLSFFPLQGSLSYDEIDIHEFITFLRERMDYFLTTKI